MTIIWATWLVALWSSHPSSTKDVATIYALEADDTFAHAIHAEAISCAIVRASLELRVQCNTLATSATPAIVAEALTGAVNRLERTLAMASTVVRTLWVFTVRTLPALLADTCTIHTLSMHSTASWANLVGA